MEHTTDTPSFDSAPRPPEPPIALAPPSPDPFADPWSPATAAPAPPRPRFTLRRSRTDRMIGGVCGGLAESLDVDVALLRLGLVALTVLGFGLGAVLYVAAWILAPVDDVG